MEAEEKSLKNHIENLVIIGSGPAGYTSGIYAARANLQPLLITGFQKGGIAGGQLMTTTFVENFPGFPDGVLGPDLMDLMKAQAIRWGTKLLEEDVEKIDLSKRPFRLETSNEIITSHSIIIATGASANKLGIQNEEKFWSLGISACAICDGATPQFRNEELAVVGGGDSACEEAVYLTKYGSHVHLIVRSDKLKASAAMADRVHSNSQITIHWESQLVSAQGEEWLSELRIKKKNSSKEHVLKVKGVFYAIGHTPNSDFLNNQLELDNKGYIITQPGRPETSIEGVYTAGDVSDSEWKQGITAASSGCKAALVAEKWLSKNNLSTLLKRGSTEPAQADSPQNLKETTEETFKSNSIWQKGSYALRKLYHESSKLLLVVYTSKSCGPCHILKPQLKRVLEEIGGEVLGIEIDIEKEQKIATQAGINGTPTVHLFKEKKLLHQWKGVKQRKEFKEVINKFMT